MLVIYVILIDITADDQGLIIINNNISLLQTHGPYTYKKMLNIYKNSNNNNNNIISQSKIVLINITLISTIAEWESEYKQ